MRQRRPSMRRVGAEMSGDERSWDGQRHYGHRLDGRHACSTAAILFHMTSRMRGCGGCAPPAGMAGWAGAKQWCHDHAWYDVTRLPLRPSAWEAANQRTRAERRPQGGQTCRWQWRNSVRRRTSPGTADDGWRPAAATHMADRG